MKASVYKNLQTALSLKREVFTNFNIKTISLVGIGIGGKMLKTYFFTLTSPFFLV